MYIKTENWNTIKQIFVKYQSEFQAVSKLYIKYQDAWVEIYPLLGDINEQVIIQSLMEIISYDSLTTEIQSVISSTVEIT